jgi:hypothetical protein
MNNLQTNSRRLVRKNESTKSENREGNVGWIIETVGKSTKLLSGLVLEGSSSNGATRRSERIRHYKTYGGQSQQVSVRGGENHAG